ncbi:O-antigen/teichoic acid export membrane protein [Chryseobacterium sp. H1D6B]|uniref:oligosaccharide flippase family protein n=1 Tax=Chryseobacterium sp. H1D6B TaxID=2940588 RepID=UPI0015C7D201|nr:oligosaccharide flippase family protein [Chryseobacterium sp. H1D6B]MDH6250684.1 O-antigen/teichoic acid export membrane protein [Chryseobacterium sp. H1D6B]
MKNSNIAKLISNYGSRLWALVSVFIFVPFYIKILGIENYAIIGFYTLLLGIISFADSGMSSAIIKEFSQDNSPSYKYSIFRNIENLYLLICVVIMSIIALGSGLIAEKWLNSNTIEIQTLSYYISLIGIGATLQLLSSLYYGALFGLGEQVKSNFYQIIWNVFRAGIVILVLIFYKPTLEVYFIWQIICNLIYIIILRIQSLSILKSQDSNLHKYFKKIPKNILKYVGGMTFIAIISAINIQADKIITSSIFPLKTFGYYNLASILSQVPVILGTPLTMFAFPLFSKFSLSNQKDLNITFDKITYLLSIIIFPVSFLLIFFPVEILKLWAGKSIESNMFSTLASVIRLLISGSLFLALQLPLFYLLLSKEKTKYTIYQGVIQVLLGIPLLYFCAKYYGLKAVPFPWILINFGSLVFLLFIVFKNFIDIKFSHYFIRTLIIPLFISFGVSFLFYLLHKINGGNIILYLVCTGILSVLINILFNNIINKRSFKEFKHLYNFPK